MDQKIKIFIYGSCVSRDFIDITESSNFEVVGFFSRSSFASIGATPITNIPTNLGNGFLERSLVNDLNKSIFQSVKNSQFDILLIDLIDERFHLVEYENSYCTKSPAFAKTLLKERHKTIRFDTALKLELWKSGVDKFFELAKQLGITQKILISKAFHATHNDQNESCTSQHFPMIELNNDVLAKMYSYISRYINEDQFLNYSEKVTVANSAHKWKRAPFHYIDDFYFSTKMQLENYYANHIVE